MSARVVGKEEQWEYYPRLKTFLAERQPPGEYMMEKPSNGSFGRILRLWRRANLWTQASVAELLGVTQAAVSRWERGRDMPSPEMRRRLRNMMASGTLDDMTVERLLLSRQSGWRVLLYLENLTLIAVSKDILKVWPIVATWMDKPLLPRLLGEAKEVFTDKQLMQEIRRGKIALISAVSSESIKIGEPKMARHRWTAGFRQAGTRMVVDLFSEPALPEEPDGVDEILRFDQIWADTNH